MTETVAPIASTIHCHILPVYKNNKINLPEHIFTKYTVRHRLSLIAYIFFSMIHHYLS